MLTEFRFKAVEPTFFHDSLQQQALSSCLTSAQMISSNCPLPTHVHQLAFMASNEHQHWNKQAGSISLTPNPNNSQWNGTTKREAKIHKCATSRVNHG